MSDAKTPCRILIIEDEALIAFYTRQLLEAAGFAVIGIAANGPAALRLGEEHRPHLALVDIRLPGDMDGIDIATVLGERYATRPIFISGTLDTATLVRARPLKPHACLEKPVRPSDLIAIVDQAVQALH